MWPCALLPANDFITDTKSTVSTSYKDNSLYVGFILRSDYFGRSRGKVYIQGIFHNYELGTE